MKFKIISVDIFQTLVDVSSIQETIFRIFLGETYTLERSETAWHLVSDRILDYFSNHITKNSHFVSVKSIFQQCYSEVFQELNIDFNPREAAEISAFHHNLADPFDDSHLFLNYLQDKYTYCISSDADNDMIEGIALLENSDRIFTSENLNTYKMSRENIFFKTILDHYKVEPDEIIHIGDSPADIINPKHLGIKTCWLNRAHAEWRHDIEPDYIFSDLRALSHFL